MSLVMLIDRDQCSISTGTCQKMLMTSHFALPLACADSSLRRANGAVAVYFILHRDDGSCLPVYTTDASQLKIMTVFCEFAQAIEELTAKLGYEHMCFKPGKMPGGFELELAPKQNAEAETLLRAGLEIIAITRGFELVRFSNKT